MGNKNDGKNPSSTKLINDINEIAENGNFAKEEQSQFAGIMKAINKTGGMEALSPNLLKEVDHVVKVLGGQQDKSVMIKDEVIDLISNISKNERHL